MQANRQASKHACMQLSQSYYTSQLTARTLARTLKKRKHTRSQVGLWLLPPLETTKPSHTHEEACRSHAEHKRGCLHCREGIIVRFSIYRAPFCESARSNVTPAVARTGIGRLECSLGRLLSLLIPSSEDARLQCRNERRAKRQRLRPELSLLISIRPRALLFPSSVQVRPAVPCIRRHRIYRTASAKVRSKWWQRR